MGVEPERSWEVLKRALRLWDTHLRKLLLQIRKKYRDTLEVWMPFCQDWGPSQGLHPLALPHPVPYFSRPVSHSSQPEMTAAGPPQVYHPSGCECHPTPAERAPIPKANILLPQSLPAPFLTLWAGAAAVAMKGGWGEREREDRKGNEVRGLE